MSYTEGTRTDVDATAADRPEGEIELTPHRSVGDRVGVLAGLAVGGAMSLSTMSISTVSSVRHIVA
ncbi:MAG: hypothetical protein AVDCRST_MAG41-2263 [uncultured Corynebacteriales bacterium]|uniref:Uncharacterized protein n=1 Tax=uncultured Mycobacteriales bacterium TaxID=581187 RepID=A0A6J4IRW1_9ACTN|nr:MAG: hypothetical protein AVDCRST_MAG41-2263 [uncultured Corynebacteriales bacterium]